MYGYVYGQPPKPIQARALGRRDRVAQKPQLLPGKASGDLQNPPDE